MTGRTGRCLFGHCRFRFVTTQADGETVSPDVGAVNGGTGPVGRVRKDRLADILIDRFPFLHLTGRKGGRLLLAAGDDKKSGQKNPKMSAQNRHTSPQYRINKEKREVHDWDQRASQEGASSGKLGKVAGKLCGLI